MRVAEDGGEVKMAEEKKARKKRGGQRGNRNSLKHGFYSRRFSAEEINDLEVFLSEGLTDEIAMLRVVARRLLTLADEAKDLDAMISVTGTLSTVTTRLAGLLRTEKALNGNANDITDTISQALKEVVRELGIAD